MLNGANVDPASLHRVDHMLGCLRLQQSTALGVIKVGMTLRHIASADRQENRIRTVRHGQFLRLELPWLERGFDG